MTKETKTNTDFVGKWLSDTRGSEFGFLKAVVYALEQFDNKNNKPIYALIAFTNGKPFGSYKIPEGRKLAGYSPALKRILDRALSGVTFVFKKDGTAGVKVAKNGGLNHDILQGLKVLIASNCTIQSDAFKEAFPVVRKATVKSKDKKLEGIQAYLKKKVSEEDDITIADLRNMIEVMTRNAAAKAGEPAH